MDYYIWGKTPTILPATPGLSSTKEGMVLWCLPRDTVTVACDKFSSQLETVVDAKGGYFGWDGDYVIWAVDRILNFENMQKFGRNIGLLLNRTKVSNLTRTTPCMDIYIMCYMIWKYSFQNHLQCQEHLPGSFDLSGVIMPLLASLAAKAAGRGILA